MSSFQSPFGSKITIATSDVLQQLRLSLAIPALVRAIQRRQIIFAMAKEIGLQVPPQQLQSAADQFRLDQQLLTSEQTWSWLERHNISLEDLELRLQEQILETMLAEHLFERQVEPTFSQSYLDNCKYQAYEFVVDDADFAMELFYALQAGEVGFATLARSHARTAKLRRRAGYLGQLRRSELPEEIAAAVVAAEPPALLRPLPVGDRWHLLEVEKRIEPELDEPQRQKILRQLFDDWIAEAIGQMNVTLTIE